MLILDRAARNALAKPPSRTTAETTAPADDTMSICSNISDGTSIYDDVESSTLRNKEISIEGKKYISFI